jgi:hypothetical protein
VQERGAPETAQADDTAGDGDAVVAAFELLARQRAVALDDLGGRVRRTEIVGEGVDAALAQLVELATARRDQIG